MPKCCLRSLIFFIYFSFLVFDALRDWDLVVMDIETFIRREKMLKLREELLAVEEDRATGRMGISPDELDSYLDSIITEAEHGAL